MNWFVKPVSYTHLDVYKRQDKAIKNMYASEYIWNSIEYDKPVGVIAEDKEQGLVSIAEPVGVICGVTPTTNPTSTTIFKALIAL